MKSNTMVRHMNWYQPVTYTVGKVDGQGHLESSDATTGKVIEGRKDVTYIYKL